jgi:uncharacterized RDD family membrane protein YckC
MRNCSLCDEEVSLQEIRQGAAITRGAEVYHRDCHRAVRKTGGGPRPTSDGGDVPVGTSFPDIGHGVEYASFWRRLGAHVIDGFVLNIVVIVATIPFGILSGLSGAEPGAGAMIGFAIGLGVPLAYYIWFWSKKGATPGKLALGVQVVNLQGEPPTAVQSLIRYLGYIPSSLFFSLGFLWMLWDDEKRTWHDMMAGTRVIRV